LPAETILLLLLMIASADGSLPVAGSAWTTGSVIPTERAAPGGATLELPTVLPPAGPIVPPAATAWDAYGSLPRAAPGGAPIAPPFAGLNADDHWLPGFYDPFSRQFAYGSAGVQAYRLGWFSYDDLVFMPKSNATVGGRFQDLEWNTSLRYSAVLPGSLVLAWTGAMNSKFWTGPSGVNFPPDGDQLLLDAQLSSNWAGPWNWQLGVTPQIDSDFNRSLNSNALMCDVRGVLLYRPAAEWTFAFGAAYWNRAHDYLIPYGGLIWAPNDRLEVRLLFPRSRISYYSGNFWGFETWGYVSLEYNNEAYQLDMQGPHVSVRGELSDYRLLKGVNFQRGAWNFFAEGGAVFDRHVRFRGTIDDFKISEGIVFRVGLTY
jgi:hypothetical protein